MKKLLCAIIILSTTTAFSQPLRLHVMGGFANYSGDIQQKSFTFQQANGVVSAGATFDLSNKFSLRSDYSFAKLGADDKRNEKENIRNRNLNFKTLIRELSITAEYNLFDLTERKFSPYVFAGIGGFLFSPYTNDSAGTKVYLQGLSTEGQGLSAYPDRKQYRKAQLNIPVGGGIKYALSDDIHLGFELGVRKLFTDYLDDVSTTYVDESILRAERNALAAQLAFRGDELKSNPQSYPAGGTIRGGSKYKDVYYFGQVRISFRMNWFDNGDGYGRRRSNLGCPTRVY